MVCSVFLQAALLLVNLTSQSLPTGPVEDDQNVWQGPVVTDAEYRVNVYSNVPMSLSLKAPITTAADDIYKYFFIVFQRK